MHDWKCRTESEYRKEETGRKREKTELSPFPVLHFPLMNFRSCIFRSCFFRSRISQCRIFGPSILTSLVPHFQPPTPPRRSGGALLDPQQVRGGAPDATAFPGYFENRRRVWLQLHRVEEKISQNVLSYLLWNSVDSDKKLVYSVLDKFATK